MRSHVLVGRFGPSDRAAVSHVTGEVVTDVDLVAAQRRLAHGLGHALEDLAELRLSPTEIGLDTAVLAALVHAADTRVSRETESEDSWTRQLHVVVPVSDPALWATAAPLLTRMLNFLTGDRWAVTFRARPGGFARLVAPRPPSFSPTYDVVSLFSGGADSLIGAINLLQEGRTPLLVSHAGDGATSDAQQQCVSALHQHYTGSTFARLRVWTAFPDGLVTGVGTEPTTRGRSFLFIALGVLAATGLAAPFTLAVPENGFIALNVPLDPLRLGSLSTKTTHPFYLACWDELLATLGISGRVENPYAHATKGEMVAACRNVELAQQVLPVSLSCASPAKARWQGRGIEQCGYCLPCLIRRAALESAWGRGNDPTPYTLHNLEERSLDTLQAEGQQVRSFQVASARLRARPELAKLLIHKPGPLRGDANELERVAGVYARGLEEVGAFLDRVQTAPV